MKNLDAQEDDNNSQAASADLARRLARYRTRVEAEGRRRSLRVIDRAITEAMQNGADDA
jgi:hypothetical protein